MAKKKPVKRCQWYGLTLVSSTTAASKEINKSIKLRTVAGYTRVPYPIPTDVFERPFKWEIRIWARSSTGEENRTHLRILSASTIIELETPIENYLVDLLVETVDTVSYGYNATIVG